MTMNRKSLKQLAAISVLTATVIAFIYYFVGHPAARHELAQIPPLILLLLLGLYILVIIAETVQKS